MFQDLIMSLMFDFRLCMVDLIQKTMSLVRYTVTFCLQEAHIQMRERENDHIKSRVCSQ
jgi:hypothetical protein